MEDAKNMKNKSRILVIGATGHLGKYLVQASVNANHPTFALVRKSTVDSNAHKAQLVQDFINSSVTVLYGDVGDHESLVEAMKKVDVVFSVMAPNPAQLALQINIISAIKQVETIKRYIPSEFGVDVERVQMPEPGKSIVDVKTQIRQAIREAGIPFTFVVSNFFPTYFLSRLGQVEATGFPEDKVIILGDGNSKVIFVDETDIAKYCIKAVDDPRTLNKILYMRPLANICSANKIASLWEREVGQIFERIYVPEEEVLKKIQDSPPPLPFYYSTAYPSFVKGEQTNFEIDPQIGVEASQLYPEIQYTTVDKLLDELNSFGFPLKR